jgi:hypothetical protein
LADILKLNMDMVDEMCYASVGPCRKKCSLYQDGLTPNAYIYFLFAHSLVVKALGYNSEGRRFETRRGEILNLPNPCGRTKPWGLLSL